MEIKDVPTIIIALCIAAVVMGIMATIVTQTRDNSANIGTATQTDNNTFTALNATYVYFGDVDHYGNQNLNCLSTSIYNSSAKLQNASFTLSGCTARLNQNDKNNTVFRAQYIKGYRTFSQGYHSSELGLQAENTLASWQVTWSVVLAAAVVLGIVSAYMYFRT